MSPVPVARARNIRSAAAVEEAVSGQGFPCQLSVDFHYVAGIHFTGDRLLDQIDR